MDFISQPTPVPEWQDGNNAFFGTPMWIHLQAKRNIRTAIKAIHEMRCCNDPEVCVYAVCVTHQDCGLNDTLRTTQPDEDGVSEFWCFDCNEYFYASNP